ncbi:MAG: amino acid ABC transporter substrate-binding protein [Spirochaetales bacterium]|nr:amino acid ABC transporter substrate-binding protein [Spirochaetales bacterium]
MKKGKRFLFGLLCITILILSGCAKKPVKESIVIGASRSIEGPLGIFEQIAFGPIYKMWAEEVNAAGGIFVKEFDKKLPIELKVYDDGSDTTKMTANLEKLVNEDSVDILLPPTGTDMLFASAPVANELGYVLIGAEGGGNKLMEILNVLPYFFSLLNFADHNHVAELADILVEQKATRVAIIAISDLHGVEYTTSSERVFPQKGIDIVIKEKVPLGIKDINPIIKKIKAANVDALLSYCYPDENIVVISQAIENNYNPKLLITGPGSNFAFFQGIFGPALEGVMGWGAWNPECSPSHKELADKLTAKYGAGSIDWWGHNIYYAGLQFIQKAIEDAGTLDQKKLQEKVENGKYETVLGRTWFDENHLLALECYSGQVGQWQNGIFEVVGPKNKATAKIIYPKPEWPGQ